MPSLQMTNWYGVLLPAGTPDATRKKIEDALARVVHDPATAARLSEAGFINPTDHVGFQKRLDADFDRWLPWLKETGIRAE
jgi:tripartite-type tricarboxylate transporter receptor subunit TctC